PFFPFFFFFSVVFPLVGSFYFSKWLRISKVRSPSELVPSGNEKEFWIVMEHPVLAGSFEKYHPFFKSCRRTKPNQTKPKSNQVFNGMLELRKPSFLSDGAKI